jgi:hypothetical protein
MRRTWWVPVLLGVASLLLYWASSMAEIGTDDTAEFQRLAPRMELIHAPGYPVQLLVGAGLAREWPPEWGGPTRAMTILSGVWTAAAVALLAAALLLATGSAWGAAIGAGAYGVAHTIWMHASLAEAYALNNLFTVILLFLFAWSEHGPGRGWRAFLASAFLIGVAAGNHLTIILLSPVVLAAYCWRHPAVRRPGRIALAALVGTAALASIQTVLVLRFDTHPNHHMVAQGMSAIEFTWWWMGGGDSRTLLFTFGVGAVLRRLVLFAGYFCYQFPSPAFLLLVLGAWAMRGRPSWLIMVGGIFAVQLLYALNFDSSDVFVFFQPCYVAGGCAAAFGVQRLQGRLRFAREPLVWLGVWLLVVVMPPAAYRLTPAALDFLGVTLSRNKGNLYYLWPPKRDVLADWNAQAEAIAAAAPPRALILTNWNNYHLMLEYVYRAGRHADLRVVVLPREGEALRGSSWAWAVVNELTQWPGSFVLGLGNVPELQRDPAYVALPGGGVSGFMLATAPDFRAWEEFARAYEERLARAQETRGLRRNGAGAMMARLFYDDAMRARSFASLADWRAVISPVR